MEREITDKCPTCGKFVSEENGYYYPENDSEFSYMALFCNEKCAQKHESKLSDSVTSFR